MIISRAHVSTPRGDVIYLEAVRWSVNCFTTSRTIFNLILLASLGAQENWQCTHIGHQCFDQLTAVKTGYPLTSITWPYRGLRCRPIEVKYFFEVIRWQVTSFQMIAGSSLIFFKFIWNMLCLCAAQLKFWLQTDLGRENSASCLQAGKTVAFDFWRSTSNFYALIGQNLTGDAASWILFTLTSEADRVLCQLLMF